MASFSSGTKQGHASTLATPEALTCERILRDRGFDPEKLREGTKSPVQFYHMDRSVWFEAAWSQYPNLVDLCEYLKAKGLTDLLNVPDIRRYTPTYLAILSGQEESARWMIANGGDLSAVTERGITVFACACGTMPLTFVEEIADKVPPEHVITDPDQGIQRASPVYNAFETPERGANPNHDARSSQIVRMLVMRGAPLDHFQIDVGRITHPSGQTLLPRRRQLLADIEADLALFDHTFIALVLGCGVHAPNMTPAVTTTTTMRTTKTVRVQLADGSWSAPFTLPCEGRPVINVTPVAPPPPHLNHLPKLRTSGNSNVRQAVAAYLGVLVDPLKLKRLRAAHALLLVLPEEEEGEEA